MSENITMKNKNVLKKKPVAVGHPVEDARFPRNWLNIHCSVLYVSGFATKKNTIVL
jgi:hypothetical protein